MAVLASAKTLSLSMSWCTHAWFWSPLPWSSQNFRTSRRPWMPPCAFVHCTNDCRPYVGPTNARGSNGLVLLAMVPMVIELAVTPTSEAVLPATGATLPPPLPLDPVELPALGPTPGRPPLTVGTTPFGPVVDVTPPGPVSTCCWPAVKSLSGSRVPHAASASTTTAPGSATRRSDVEVRDIGQLCLSRATPRSARRSGRGGRAAVPCRGRRRTRPARRPGAPDRGNASAPACLHAAASSPTALRR